MSAYEETLAALLEAAPELAQAPWLAMPLSQSRPSMTTAQSSAHAANTMVRAKAIKRHKDHHGHGFFGGVVHAVTKVGSGAARTAGRAAVGVAHVAGEAASDVAGAVQKLNPMLQSHEQVTPEQLSQEAAAAGKDPEAYAKEEMAAGRLNTGSLGATVVARTGVVTAEGMVNALNAPLEEVQHQYRYLHDVQARHGVAAMLAELGPIAAGAAVGGLVAGPQGAVLGGEAAGGIAGRISFTDSWERTHDQSYRDSKGGRPINIGEDVATFLPKIWGGELKRGTAPYKTLAVVSGAIAVMALDPVAAGAGLAKEPAGLLGKLQPDRTLLNAADVDRILSKSRTARLVFEDIASKPASQIAHDYPAFAEISRDLGKAETVDAVASVFRDAFDQAEITGLVVPRTSVRSRVIEPTGLADTPAGDERIGRLALAKRRAQTRIPMTLDPQTLRLSNTQLDPVLNNAESFEAVRRVLKMGNLSDRAVEGVVNDYINTASVAERLKILRNGTVRSMVGLLPKKLANDPMIEAELRQHVTDWMGGISGGIDDLYGFNTMGQNLSKITLENGAETAAGIWLNHRGPITLPNYVAVQRWAREADAIGKYFGRVDDFMYSRLIIPFKRLALLTGGFALRVGTAEGIPAVLRNGFHDTIAGAIHAKAAKLGFKLEQDEAGHITAAMEKLAGGAEKIYDIGAKLHLSSKARKLAREELERDRELAMDIVMRTDSHFLPPALSGSHFVTNDAIGKFEQEALNIFKAGQNSHRFRETDQFMSFGQGSRDLPLYWQRALREAANDDGVPALAAAYRNTFLKATKEGKSLSEAISEATEAAVAKDREFLNALPDIKKSAYLRASTGEDALGDWARTRVENFKGLTHTPDIERVRWMNEMAAGGELAEMPAESARPLMEIIDHIARGPEISAGRFVEAEGEYGRVLSVNKRAGTAKVHFPDRDSTMELPLDGLNTQGLNELPRSVLDNIQINDRPLQVKGRAQVPDVSGNLTERWANVGHGKVLGPVINTLGREHQYFLAVKESFEPYRALIKRGLIDEDTAMGDAMLKATRKVLKFVHNPSERTQLAVMMRTMAPFFFAQEQAYRRVGRLIADDPKAFVRYMRAVMAMRNYTHEVEDRTGFAQVLMPGLGFIDEGFVKAAQAIGLPVAGTVPISVMGNVHSMNTILPFTEDNPFRPNWSPVVTFPAHVLMNIDPATREWVTPAIGETAAAGSALNVLIPNTVIRNLVNATVMGDRSTQVQSSTISVLQALAFQQEEAMRKWVEDGHDPTDEGHPQIVPDATASHREKQQFITRVRNQARILLVGKALISAGTPLAPSLAIGYPELSKEYADAIAEFGITEGTAKFLEDNPDATPYTISKSSSPQGPALPPYKMAQEFYDEHKSLFDEFPEAAAYFLPQSDGEYDSAVYNEQIALGLRERKDAARWSDDYYIAAGNHQYWDVDYPKYQQALEAARSKSEQAEIRANWSTYLNTELSVLNPTWWDYFTSTERENERVNAIRQLRQVYDAGKAPRGEMADNIGQLLVDYGTYLTAVEAGRQRRWTANQRDALAENWKAYLDEQVKEKPALGMVVNRLFRPLVSQSLAQQRAA